MTLKLTITIMENYNYVTYLQATHFSWAGVIARGRFDHNILNANRQYPDTFSSRRKKMR